MDALWREGGLAVALVVALSVLQAVWRAHQKQQAIIPAFVEKQTAQFVEAIGELRSDIREHTTAIRNFHKAAVEQGLLRPRRPTGSHAS